MLRYGLIHFSTANSTSIKIIFDRNKREMHNISIKLKHFITFQTATNTINKTNNKIYRISYITNINREMIKQNIIKIKLYKIKK